MQKFTTERIELDVNDRIAVENAICDRIDALDKRKDAESINERNRLRKIYEAMVCCRVFIECDCGEDA